MRFETRVLTPTDPEYPSWLRQVQDRPPVVYVRGQLPPDRRCVACVGTRQPSTFGKLAARGISRFLAAHGWSIVSGLAIGVDTLCHEGALEAGGHTVAVLANGLDSVYPRQNTALAERILTAGGALMSEQPNGTPALPKYLFRRNRIQSGMSAGTVVMQTNIVGGTMHTARYTLLQERLLFAARPQGAHAEEPKSRGLLALSQRTGADLARLLDAKEVYAKLLERKFADRPVAMPLAGRKDYAKLLGVLEATISRTVGFQAPTSQPPAQQLALSLGDN
jgi:DNA processing protein